MNGYDFDQTIYKYDCYKKFYWYCLLKRLYIAIFLPYQLSIVVLYLLHIIDRMHLKNQFYCFMFLIKNRQKLIEKFWDKEINNINKWYLKQKDESDVVISASPLFLVEPACRRLGIKNVIASNIDLHNMKVLSKNCYGQQKVERFNEVYGKDFVIDSFYSDSLSDIPMFKRAKNAYLVKGEIVTKYNVV